jgi:uncharacterized protein (TIGR03083 family)
MIMSDTITNAELMRLIRKGRAEFEALLGQMTDEQMARRGAAGDWSVKDILAHLTFWEQSMLRRIKAVVRGERPESMRVEGEEWETTMNRINDQNFAANRQRPHAEVLADFQRSHQEAIAFIGTISDADLAEGSRAAQTLGRPLHDLIAGDTYEHYAEHGDAIRQWLKQR